MGMNKRTDITLIIGIGLILLATIALVVILWANFGGRGDDAAELAETSPPTEQAPTQAPEAPAELPTPQVQVLGGDEQPTQTETQEPTPAEPEPAAPTEETQAQTEQPTETPTDAPPGEAMVTAGNDGVNVRKGPGTNYARFGFLDPGAQAKVTGKYINWWQIEYGGGLGWVYGEVVSAANTDNIPQVQPPAAPTAVPPTATPKPQPTATSKPAADFRGLTPLNYWVEGAPGPYGVNSMIWFNWEISSPGGDFPYNALGTWVAETEQFQKSWGNEVYIPPTWRDHIEIPNAGTYNLYLRICFNDNYCVNLMGPVPVTVQ